MSGRSDGPHATKRRRPRMVFHSKTIIVYDDFLPEPVFDAVFSICNSADYLSVHRESWSKVWRLHDGEPLRGPTWYWSLGKPKPERKRSSYPTRTALDKFIEALCLRRAEIAPVVGTAGTDWDAFSICPWIYRAGSGLSLHQDGEPYSGAYTFYVHRQWKIHWGGHLLVLDRQRRSTADRSTGESAVGVHPPWLDDRLDDTYTRAPGISTCIFPKPNRLVLVSGHVPHLVTRVDASAGDHARVTLAGFFVKPKRARI